jgi:hypothetical protein
MKEQILNLEFQTSNLKSRRGPTPPLRNGISIRNAIRNGFSPVLTRLVADVRINAFFLDVLLSKYDLKFKI